MKQEAERCQFRPIRMALEPRILLDAAAVPTLAAQTADHAGGADPTESDKGQSATPAKTRTEIAFVFSDVADSQAILAGLAQGTQVIRLDQGQDGLTQMLDALAGRTDIDALHVIGHGDQAGLALGSFALDLRSVESRNDELAMLGQSLAADADILFYGCDAGQGGTGGQLAQALADATHADIALSNDATGAESRGGDWDLEVTCGQVESQAIQAPDWNGLLQTTVAADQSSGGTLANGAAGSAVVSQDGRYVAFTSGASNLVTGDTNGVDDVFLRDTQTGVTTRISVSSGGGQANGASSVSDISEDGRYVVFASTATNLVTGDTNSVSDVFVRDLQNGTTLRVSLNGGGNQGNGASTGGAISGDGTKVVFDSVATNLVAGDTNSVSDVFLRDMQGGTTNRISLGAAGAQGNGASTQGVISSDGSIVAFTSAASNLVAGDTNGVSDVFIHDLGNHATVRASVGNAGAQGSGASSSPSLSTTGQFVAFSSQSAFSGSDTNASADIYRRDMTGGQTILISQASDGSAANGASSAPSISGGGEYVALSSTASNLVSSDTNGVSDVFVRDLSGSTAQTLRVSVAHSSNAQGTGASDNARISADGGQVAFRSSAANLIGADGNGVAGIFLAQSFTVTATDRGLGRNIAMQPRPAAPPPPPLLAGFGAERPAGADAALAAPLSPPTPIPGEGAIALALAMPRPGGAEQGGIGTQTLPPPGGTAALAERLGQALDQNLSLAERQSLMRGLPIGGLIDGLRGRGDPPARAMAALIERVQAGETVTQADVRAALSAEGASGEETQALMVALYQAQKTLRTERVAGALKELANNAQAADAFARPQDAPRGSLVELTSSKVALLIGVQSYQGGLPPLSTPGADVNAVSASLSEKFGYQTIVASDANKAEIVDLIRSVGDRLDGQGSLIVYYAGHGYAVESTGEGYWLPAGARTDSAAGWISTRDLSTYLGQVKAGQIMVISDSCYSGALTRQMRLTSDAVGEPKDQIFQRRSVTALSSGGDEPVRDGGGDGHSVFASKLLGALDQAGSDSMGFQLFAQVRSDVTALVPQEPTYGGLTQAGHAGRTDFVLGGR